MQKLMGISRFVQRRIVRHESAGDDPKDDKIIVEEEMAKMTKKSYSASSILEDIQYVDAIKENSY